jgi:hypothetical protein
VAGIVHYFLPFQQPNGSIIDPIEKIEIQYSTPCYAMASATLFHSGYDKRCVSKINFNQLRFLVTIYWKVARWLL